MSAIDAPESSLRAARRRAACNTSADTAVSVTIQLVSYARAEGKRGAAKNPSSVRILVFDDPTLQGPYEWLVEDSGDVHEAMRALARQAYRRNRRELPEERVVDQLRAHGTIDARPYVPPSAA
jgi:hypothetical protein